MYLVFLNVNPISTAQVTGAFEYDSSCTQIAPSPWLPLIIWRKSKSKWPWSKPTKKKNIYTIYLCTEKTIITVIFQHVVSQWKKWWNSITLHYIHWPAWLQTTFLNKTLVFHLNGRYNCALPPSKTGEVIKSVVIAKRLNWGPYHIWSKKHTCFRLLFQLWKQAPR